MPPCQPPRAALRSMPAMTRSIRVSRSNSANTPSIWTIIRPAGVAVSKGSVADRLLDGSGAECDCDASPIAARRGLGEIAAFGVLLQGVRGAEVGAEGEPARAVGADELAVGEPNDLVGVEVGGGGHGLGPGADEGDAGS